MANYLVTDTELISIANSVRNKAEINNLLEYPTDFISTINALPVRLPDVPIKDVNFYDYDGRRVYSYTYSEWSNVTALPPNPTHDGLVAQGWNWTKAQIDDQIFHVPIGVVNVGQMYITASEKTEIDIELQPWLLSPNLIISPNGTVSVDWGDGSVEDTITGTSLTGVKYQQHNYASAGKYTIKITSVSGSYAFSCLEILITGVLNATTQYSRCGEYSSAVKAIRLGKNSNIGSSAFFKCTRLETITIPNHISSFGKNAFAQCWALKNIVVPSGMTSIQDQYFVNTYNTERIILAGGTTTLVAKGMFEARGIRDTTIPYTFTSITDYCYSYCENLTEIVIPSNVTSVGIQALYLSGIAKYHFLSTTPPTLQSNALSIDNNTIIYVPYSSDHSVLTAYQNDSSWSSYVSKLQEEPQ